MQLELRPRIDIVLCIPMQCLLCIINARQSQLAAPLALHIPRAEFYWRVSPFQCMLLSFSVR